ncbi:hypothetical protein HRbin40_02296 [bacterium HR40]|nr:hypothetical protein HRbin40_02296 [bacterium HR40]
MPDVGRWFGQSLILAGFVTVIGFFSQRPTLVVFPPDRAQLVVSFAHGAERREACRRLTPQEIARLPPQQRRPNTCERERLPVRLVLAIDGNQVFDGVLEPTGIWGDGPSRAYLKFALPPGRHHLVLKLEDRGRGDAFAYVSEREIELGAGRRLAVDFKADAGGFLFYG